VNLLVQQQLLQLPLLHCLPAAIAALPTTIQQKSGPTKNNTSLAKFHPSSAEVMKPKVPAAIV